MKRYRCTRYGVLFGLCCALCIALTSCVNSPPVTKEPSLFMLQQFQWQSSNQSEQINMPVTSNSPGPVVSVKALHQQGLGLLLSNAHISLYEESIAQKMIATISTQMKQQGWQPLFSPTATGSYPDYVLYVTFKSNTHYCFVEYSAIALNAQQASQQIDMYHN